MTSLTGTISTFGGPKDLGVSPTEGLALIEPGDLQSWWYRHLFLPGADPRKGLARQLDPAAHYIAMRWAYDASMAGKLRKDGKGRELGVCLSVVTPRNLLRNSTVTIVANGRSIQARPVDWGPNSRTGRLADLSPGAAAELGLRTDQTATIVLPWT